MFRIGFGYDVHRLVEGRSLIIGGVDIPYHLGLVGHSDADVLTHAIIDAGYDSKIKPWTKTVRKEVEGNDLAV